MDVRPLLNVTVTLEPCVAADVECGTAPVLLKEGRRLERQWHRRRRRSEVGKGQRQILGEQRNVHTRWRVIRNLVGNVRRIKGLLPGIIVTPLIAVKPVAMSVLLIG